MGVFPPQGLDPWMPVLTVLLCGGLVLALYLCERFDLGRVFRAIENNDAIVETVGINVMSVKLLCLVLASFAVGAAGAGVGDAAGADEQVLTGAEVGR